jgi:hypothetical protein
MIALQNYKIEETIVDVKLRGQSIGKRLAELRGFAADDNIIVNEESIADFLSIFNENADFTLPAIFMEDNGDISVTWQDTKRLSVIFYGGSETQTIKYSSFNKQDLPFTDGGSCYSQLS